MLKKSLVFGSIVLLLGMLLAFTGCDNPAGPEGPPGPPGTPGTPGTPGGPGGGNNNDTDDDTDDDDNPPIIPPDGYALIDPAITATDLAAAFEATTTKVVVLRKDVLTVEGIVPANGALYVLGNAKVSGKNLEVQGALTVWDEAGLTATGADGSGFLKGAGTITVEDGGILLLPYDPGKYLHSDFITYESENVTNGKDVINEDAQKAIGAIVSYTGSPAAVTATKLTTAAQIVEVFATLKKFTAYNITGLSSTATTDWVPADSELTLAGENNTLAPGPATINLSGTLKIAGTLKTGTGGTTIYPERIQILEGGTLDLTVATDAFDGLKMAEPNKGTIKTVVAAGTAAAGTVSLETILGFVDGKVEAGAAIATGTVAFTVPKGVDLTLKVASPFTGGDDITVEGKLTLGAGADFVFPASITIKEPTTGTAEENKNNGVLVLAGDNTQKLTIGDGEILTIQNPAKISGLGKIIAEGTTGTAGSKGTITITIGKDAVVDAGYVTPLAGVVANSIPLAVAAIAETDKDVLKITSDSTGTIDLTTGTPAYTSTAGTKGLGTVEFADGIATVEVKNGSSSVELPSGITFVGAPYTPTLSGTHAADLTAGNFPLTLKTNTRILSITDGGTWGATTKKAVATFTGVKLEHTSGLISPARPTFNIGVSTGR